MNDLAVKVHKLIVAINKGDIDSVRAGFVDKATWWVDTGNDREIGASKGIPDTATNWPLHGRVSIDTKLLRQAEIESHWKRRPALQPNRIFSGEDWAVIEAESYGINGQGRIYNNRHALVIHFQEQRIDSISEYYDTLHAADLYQTSLGKRTHVLDLNLTPACMQPHNKEEEVAARFFDSLNQVDLETVTSLFHTDATWWTDTGSNRAAGRQDEEAKPGHSWSLHGTLPIGKKLRAMENMPSAFPKGLSVIPTGYYSSPPYVAVEAFSHGEFISGHLYQNRYLWLFLIRDQRISSLREYNDTAHVVEIFGP